MSALLALLLVAGLCPPVHPTGTPELENVARGGPQAGEPVDTLQLASSNTEFAFSLYKQLASKNPNRNVVFSPLSISMALAFLSLGARSTTLTEILEGLKFNLTETPEAEIHRGFQNLLGSLSRPSDPLQLSVGNAMFVSESLKLLDTFKADAQALFASEAFSTNFQNTNAAERLINRYVEKKTQGKIVDLIKGLNPRTAMVLVNYIFFKAKWKTPFDPRDTVKTKFHVSKTRSVNVPMMNVEDLRAPYLRDTELACTLVELQYTSGDSALFILPDPGKMKQVEDRLNPETLRRWRALLQMSDIDELSLPKFSITSNYQLEKTLPRLGVSKVFTRQADLSGITSNKKLKVSQVVHQTVLDVAEVGTEAAAATGIKITPLSAKWGSNIYVRFDRPFLLAIICKKTQSVLFLAKVVNPNQGRAPSSWSSGPARPH
ncbi:PREDICTED: alpha-1-antichymotrypsin [Condylura cristata]|uniref:alpha-1-antichymotrypsin n=1 Tax=Condylura cristata TaxID=143302 RepID=UPI000642BC9E|nr:PREDICTED: alpha-1-antichymotrypsin [Condylura cristata]